MKLFYLKDLSPGQFQVWFIVETVFLLASYTACLVGIITLSKVRIHIHFKIYCVFMFFEVIVYFTGRLIIIGYQSGLLVSPVPAEHNAFIVFSSWFKGYFLIQVLTSSFWVAAEREFSFYYIEDYEKRQRLWIPTLIIIAAVVFAGFLSSCFTFDFYLRMSHIIIIACVVALIGLLMYVHNWRKTLRLNTLLKNKKESNIRYSLSIRYQLEENLWCARILRNGVITLSGVNFFTFIVFICAYSPTLLPEETRELLDCLFNVIVAINGPLLAVGSALYNEPVIKELKSLFKRSSVDVTMADGEVYFRQLMHQWEEPFEVEEKKEQVKKKPLQRMETIEI